MKKRVITGLIILAFVLASCGKKAPPRPADKEENKTGFSFQVNPLG